VVVVVVVFRNCFFEGLCVSTTTTTTTTLLLEDQADRKPPSPAQMRNSPTYWQDKLKEFEAKEREKAALEGKEEGSSGSAAGG